MKTVQISLNSIDKVKSFVNDITKFDYDFDLVSGRYVIDAKSIMGIFSLYYNRFSGSCIYLTCVCVIKSLCAVYVDVCYSFLFHSVG